MSEQNSLQQFYIVATLGYRQNYSDAGSVYKFLSKIDPAKPAFVDYPKNAYSFESKEDALNTIAQIEKAHKGNYARWQILEFYKGKSATF